MFWEVNFEKKNKAVTTNFSIVKVHLYQKMKLAETSWMQIPSFN